MLCVRKLPTPEVLATDVARLYRRSALRPRGVGYMPLEELFESSWCDNKIERTLGSSWAAPRWGASGIGASGTVFFLCRLQIVRREYMGFSLSTGYRY